jgi:hypothetical protein
MKTITTFMLVFFTAIFSLNVHASSFCDGFREGYLSVKGNNAMVPMCPMETMTPMGSTPFRAGIKAGIRAATRQYIKGH